MHRSLLVLLFACSQVPALSQNAPSPLPPTEPEPEQQPPPKEPSLKPGAPFSGELGQNQSSARQATQPAAPTRRDSPAPPEARRAQGITAMEALRRLTERFGRQPFSLLVEMKGLHGQTQPSSWRVTTVDLANPFLTRTFTVDKITEMDAGDGKSFYPDQIPGGFVALRRLSIGSYDAFVALDKAASDAKIGFDSIVYRLRGREGSNEPVWTLTALDTDGLAVGMVDVSGVSGIVLRTVWLRRSGVRSLPTVEDSALKRALRQ